MFDWDDEELSDIIWGGTGESDDHLVPYPVETDGKPQTSYGDCVNEEWDNEASKVKLIDQKKLAAKSGSYIRSGSSSKHASAADEAHPALEFAFSNFQKDPTKADQGFFSKEPSNHIGEISEHEDGTVQQGTNSKIFQKQQEDGEQSDFIEYDWNSIGSFDDLENFFRNDICSNDDPIIGYANLPNTEELWSSSKDPMESPEKSIAMSVESPNLGLGELRSTLGNFENEEEYLLDQYQTFYHAYDKVKNITQDASQALHTYETDKIIPFLKEKRASDTGGEAPAFHLQLDTGIDAIPKQLAGKENSQKAPLEGRNKSEEHGHISQPQGLCESWSPSMSQLNDQCILANQQYPSVFLSQSNHLQSPLSLQYNQYPGPPILVSPVVGDFTNQYPVSTLTQPHVSPSAKRMPMTPQEKIEKLRRRQQMRAMLATQRQQQIGNQVLSTDHYMGVEDNMCTIPSIVDPNSPLEQNDPSTAGISFEDQSMEQSVLNRLQDIVSKLDIRIRLCIRDSLFRLAQSAAQRQHIINDTSSTNKGIHESVPNQDEINSSNSNYRIARLPNVEKETNPIDRIVAHLLFHQPTVVLSTRVAEMPESQLLDKLYNESNATFQLSLPRRNLPHSRGESHLVISPQSLKAPSSYTEGEQAQINPCFETYSENILNHEPAGGVVVVDPL
ncbi:unnamed protein product [Cuscuta europaea]|uniref:Protein LNK2 n=1 Tax=Cuscuta europaea TaxID=41803 RepID=A0A9P0ZDJ4_CUSEU|nr:unnamed protein product [Cuscuta europaea]